MTFSQQGSISIPGLVHRQSLPGNLEYHVASRPRLLIVMVGLPARGKSYIAKKLARYLNWLQYTTRIFNVGERRRMTHTPKVAEDTCQVAESECLDSGHNASFFDPNCTAARQWREQLAMSVLDDLLNWFDTPEATFGIFDATNSTAARRRTLLAKIKDRASTAIDVLFLESVCDDPAVLERNMRLKLSGPDYASHVSDIALMDLRERIQHYTSAYTPLGDEEVSKGVPFIKTFDTGRQVTINRVQSFLSMVALDYVLSFHLDHRKIWLTCSGQSLDDVEGRIGRQSDLSDEGVRFSCALAEFMSWQETGHACKLDEKNDSSIQGCGKMRNSQCKAASCCSGLSVWTSTMAQSIQTSERFSPSNVIRMKMLSDIEAGDMRGMTYEQISTLYPDIFAARAKDVVNFRWPGVGGESYGDVINRLRLIVLEIERSRNEILVISHRAIVRVLLTYFMGLDKSQLLSLKVPYGSVFSVEPGAYAAKVQMYRYDSEAGCFRAPIQFEV